MQVTSAVVRREYEWTRARASTAVPVANDVRDRLGEVFGVDVPPITVEQYESAIDEVYDDGNRAVNLAAMTAILRDLDVDDDHPGFIVDEILGREIAAMIGGEHPLRMLAEATFHYADVHTHTEGPAGVDDLDAALAAGVQTRLPGWEWTETDPFSIR